MTLIDGDRIVTVQIYDDEHEEYTEKKMSVIDFIDTYTDEGVTETDVVEQARWIPVSKRLPEEEGLYLVYTEEQPFVCSFEDGEFFIDEVLAWMPLPEPYKAESEG